MAGLFIDVQLSARAAADTELGKKLIEICPCAIFAEDDNNQVQTVDTNMDECVLCDLCVQAAPNGDVTVVKLYEN